MVTVWLSVPLPLIVSPSLALSLLAFTLISWNTNVFCRLLSLLSGSIKRKWTCREQGWGNNYLEKQMRLLHKHLNLAETDRDARREVHSQLQNHVWFSVSIGSLCNARPRRCVCVLVLRWRLRVQRGCVLCAWQIVGTHAWEISRFNVIFIFCWLCLITFFLERWVSVEAFILMWKLNSPCFCNYR